MLTYQQNAKRQDSSWIFFCRILGTICLVALLVFAFTHGTLINRLAHEYPTVALLAAWLTGMLSYHQDAKHHDSWWAMLSQTLAVVCLIAIVVFGFTRRLWLNFLIAPSLAWLHVQFTKRWWTRRGAWW